MIATLLAFSLVLADVPAPVTAAAVRYEAALQELQTKKKGASVQRVYEAALAVVATIERIENVSTEEISSIGEAIPALRLRAGATPAVDPTYFLAVAEKHGSAADADFFKALARSETGHCTRVAGGDLLAAYKGWFTYSRKYNPAWRAHVIEQIQAIERAFTTSTCMCEDAVTVRAALADVARDFPLGKITPRVRQRIQEIDRGTSDIRFECDPQR